MGIFGLCHCLVDYFVFCVHDLVYYACTYSHTLYIITLIRYYNSLIIVTAGYNGAWSTALIGLAWGGNCFIVIGAR